MLDSKRTLMTVIGIMMNPADARAVAPVLRLAMLESRGNDEEEEEEEEEWFGPPFGTVTNPVEARMLERATCCLSAFRVEKYKADPKPVRMTDGRVPRHNCLKEWGLCDISWIVWRSEAEPDCWTRVFSRSAG